MATPLRCGTRPGTSFHHDSIFGARIGSCLDEASPTSPFVPPDTVRSVGDMAKKLSRLPVRRRRSEDDTAQPRVTPSQLDEEALAKATAGDDMVWFDDIPPQATTALQTPLEQRPVSPLERPLDHDPEAWDELDLSRRSVLKPPTPKRMSPEQRLAALESRALLAERSGLLSSWVQSAAAGEEDDDDSRPPPSCDWLHPVVEGASQSQQPQQRSPVLLPRNLILSSSPALVPDGLTPEDDPELHRRVANIKKTKAGKVMLMKALNAESEMWSSVSEQAQELLDQKRRYDAEHPENVLHGSAASVVRALRPHGAGRMQNSVIVSGGGAAWAFFEPPTVGKGTPYTAAGRTAAGARPYQVPCRNQGELAGVRPQPRATTRRTWRRRQGRQHLSALAPSNRLEARPGAGALPHHRQPNVPREPSRTAAVITLKDTPVPARGRCGGDGGVGGWVPPVVDYGAMLAAQREQLKAREESDKQYRKMMRVFDVHRATMFVPAGELDCQRRSSVDEEDSIDNLMSPSSYRSMRKQFDDASEHSHSKELRLLNRLAGLVGLPPVA